MVSRWRAAPYTCFVNAKLIRGALLNDIKAISRSLRWMHVILSTQTSFSPFVKLYYTPSKFFKQPSLTTVNKREAFILYSTSTFLRSYLNLAPNLKIIKLRSSISKKTLKTSLINFVIFFVQTDETYDTKMFNRLLKKKERKINSSKLRV